MSSDFLEFLDDDENGSYVDLTMKASGHAFLYVGNEEGSSFYHLSPDKQGWERAEMIVNAINAWMTHTKRIFPENL
jgi:16S rRNA C1402 N4-methylase RsmH